MARQYKIILGILGLVVLAFVIIAAVNFLDTVGVLAILGAIGIVIVTIIVVLFPHTGPLFIIAALPFERLLTVDLGGVTVKPIHAMILAVLIAWFICLVQRRITEIKFPLPLTIALIYFLVGVWSLGVSIDPKRTMMVLIFWLVALLGFFLIVQFIQKEDVLRQSIVFLVIASGLLALFGFYQIAGDIAGLPKEITGIKAGYDKATFGLPRVHATLPEPLYYASYLFVPFFLSVAFFLYGGIKNSISRWLILFIALALLVNIVLTFSRGAFLGLLIAGALLIVWQYRKFFQWRNIVVILSIAFLGMMLVWGAFTIAEPRAVDEVYEHLSLSKKESESVVARLEAVEIAYNGWYSNIWRGIGLGSYGYLELEERGELHLTEGYYPIVNNQYIETLAETGIFGALFFGLLIISILWRSARAWLVCHDDFERATLAGLTLGFIGILAQYLTFSTIYIIYVWVFIGILVATQEIILNKSKIKNQKSK